MPLSVVKSEVVKQVKALLAGSLSAAEIEAVLDTTAQVVAKNLREGQTVEIRPFGKWIPHTRAARVGRNPQTKEPVQIPARKVVKFRLSKQFKELAIAK